MTQNQHTDYTHQNKPLQQQYTPAGQEGQGHPVTMRKRIGSTTYRVRVHFSNTNTETLNDKILRMVKNEAVSE